jgi:hypothetical protein
MLFADSTCMMHRPIHCLCTSWCQCIHVRQWDHTKPRPEVSQIKQVFYIKTISYYILTMGMVRFKMFGSRIMELFAAEQQDDLCKVMTCHNWHKI